MLAAELPAFLERQPLEGQPAAFTIDPPRLYARPEAKGCPACLMALEQEMRHRAREAHSRGDAR